MDAADFKYWKDNYITQALFQRLQEIRENICSELLDVSVIMSNQSDKRLAFLAGERESLDLVLNITAEDISDEKTE